MITLDALQKRAEELRQLEIQAIARLYEIRGALSEIQRCLAIVAQADTPRATNSDAASDTGQHG